MLLNKKFKAMPVLGALVLGFLSVNSVLGMAAPVEIIEMGAKYQSEDIKVHVGQPILLTNKDPFFHQSQIRKLNEHGIEYPIVISVLEPQGATVEVSLKEPGPYKLRCKIHDGMVLNIQVIQ